MWKTLGAIVSLTLRSLDTLCHDRPPQGRRHRKHGAADRGEWTNFCPTPRKTPLGRTSASGVHKRAIVRNGTRQHVGPARAGRRTWTLFCLLTDSIDVWLAGSSPQGTATTVGFEKLGAGMRFMCSFRPAACLAGCIGDLLVCEIVRASKAVAEQIVEACVSGLVVSAKPLSAVARHRAPCHSIVDSHGLPSRSTAGFQGPSETLNWLPGLAKGVPGPCAGFQGPSRTCHALPRIFKSISTNFQDRPRASKDIHGPTETLPGFPRAFQHAKGVQRRPNGFPTRSKGSSALAKAWMGLVRPSRGFQTPDKGFQWPRKTAPGLPASLRSNAKEFKGSQRHTPSP